MSNRYSHAVVLAAHEARGDLVWPSNDQLSIDSTLDPCSWTPALGHRRTHTQSSSSQQTMWSQPPVDSGIGSRTSIVFSDSSPHGKNPSPTASESMSPPRIVYREPLPASRLRGASNRLLIIENDSILNIGQPEPTAATNSSAGSTATVLRDPFTISRSHSTTSKPADDSTEIRTIRYELPPPRLPTHPSVRSVSSAAAAASSRHSGQRPIAPVLEEQDMVDEEPYFGSDEEDYEPSTPVSDLADDDAPAWDYSSKPIPSVNRGSIVSSHAPPVHTKNLLKPPSIGSQDDSIDEAVPPPIPRIKHSTSIKHSSPPSRSLSAYIRSNSLPSTSTQQPRSPFMPTAKPIPLQPQPSPTPKKSRFRSLTSLLNPKRVFTSVPHNTLHLLTPKRSFSTRKAPIRITTQSVPYEMHVAGEPPMTSSEHIRLHSLTVSSQWDSGYGRG